MSAIFRPWPRRATHATAFIVGVCLAVAVGRSGRDGPAGVSSGKARGADAAVASRGEGGPRAALDMAGKVERLSSREYQEAWDAIARRRLSLEERLDLQRDVLRQWSLVDLPAAARAMLAGRMGSDVEPWLGDGDRGPGSYDGGVNQLAGCFRKALLRDPVGAWDLLDAPEFHAELPLFDYLWPIVLERDREALLALAGRMPPELVVSCAREAIGGIAEDDWSGRHGLLLALASLPGTRDMRAVVLKAAMDEAMQVGGPDDLVARVNDAATEPERTVAMAEYLSAVRSDTDGGMRESWKRFPPELRDQALAHLMDPEVRGMNTTGMLDYAIDAGRYDLLEDPAALEAMRNGRMDDGRVDWALALPPVPQAEKMFDKIARTHLSVTSPEQARAWIDGIHTPWHRGRAAAVLEKLAEERR